MYQLTINSGHAGTIVTDHDDPSQARDALYRYAVGADVYLQHVQGVETHTSFDLIELGDPPRATGRAVIEPMPAPAVFYYQAGAARRWIDQHRDATTGYPARVLAGARAAATNHAAAASLLREAAALADVAPSTDVDPLLLEYLTDQIATTPTPLSSARLASMVAAVAADPDTGAVLTWWIALISGEGLPS
jgi:hypothetical protein